MAEQPGQSNDTAAAQLTAAMPRFDIERLARNPVAVPYDNPWQRGEIAFVFLPRQELVFDSDPVRHVEGMPQPALLGALAPKGLIATWSPSGSEEGARAAWEHDLANQLEWVAKFFADQLGRRGPGATRDYHGDPPVSSRGVCDRGVPPTGFTSGGRSETAVGIRGRGSASI